MIRLHHVTVLHGKLMHLTQAPSPAGCIGNYWAHLVALRLLQHLSVCLHSTPAILKLQKPLHLPPWVTVFHALLLSILLGIPQPFNPNAPVSFTLSHPLGVFPFSKR